MEERWSSGSFALGVLHDHYRREVSLPPATVDTNQTSPWLLNIRTGIEAGRELLFYGGYVQGLEDSALAPVSAANRNEPPPATRTWQIDGGIRWVPNQKLQFVLGAFKIHKPYFNLDAEIVFGNWPGGTHRPRDLPFVQRFRINRASRGSTIEASGGAIRR